VNERTKENKIPAYFFPFTHKKNCLNGDSRLKKGETIGDLAVKWTNVSSEIFLPPCNIFGARYLLLKYN
jgi:hypothetical protein